MEWNLEGLRVRALYLQEYPVSGRVELSRVAYGGAVHHTIVLDQPLNLFGNDRSRVIVEHSAVEQVWSNQREPV